MSDQPDPLADARAFLAAGRLEEALHLAWNATMPAVLSQDASTLTAAAALAAEIADATTGALAKEARENAAYWTACIAMPRDSQPSSWSIRSWFRRAPKGERVPCPDCAELILTDAKVCRFCGYRLDA